MVFLAKGGMMKDKGVFRKIYSMAKPYKKQIIIVVIISIIINIFELVNPYLVRIVIDDYLSKKVYTIENISVYMIGALYIFIVIASNLLDFLTRCMTSKIGEGVVFTLRNKLFSYVEHANASFHDKISTGKLFVRITNDAEDILNLFKDVITTVIKDIVMIVAIICIMVYFSAKLSLMAFLVIPLICLASFFITRALSRAYTFSKSIRTKLNTFMAESIYGIRLIKIFNRYKEKEKECKRLLKEFYDSRKITALLEGLLPGTMYIIENLAISIIVVVSSKNFLGVDLEPGLVYVFITYIKKLFEPITRIIENIEVVEDAVVSINKIYDILDKEEYLEDLEKGKYITDLKGKIEFKHVWFSYDKENYVLKDVNFTINPHESVALVGKTGSGKTTITNLINRFYEVDKGQILIDGVDIKDINLTSLRKNVGTILQDPFIFARSIKDNIKLNVDMSDKLVSSALKISSASNFVNKLPGKVEYVAKERGNSFSVGQKQLIAFARVFAHNPSIFIFDEATANIDTHTERLIQRSVDIISEEKTSIFIAHRLSTIVNVDKIFVLDDGKIIESGSHSELLKSGGYYSELYNAYYTSLS